MKTQTAGKRRFYTASGPIEVVRVRYVAAPFATAFGLLQEAARRTIDRSYLSPFTQIARLSPEVVHHAFLDTQGCVLGNLLTSYARNHADLLRAAVDFILKRRDATGLESIYASALQSAWPYLDPHTAANALAVWERFVRQGSYAEQHDAFVFDGSRRTVSILGPRGLAALDTGGGLADLVSRLSQTPSASGGSQVVGRIPELGGYGPGGFQPGGPGLGGFGQGGFGPGGARLSGFGQGGFGQGGFGPGGFESGSFGPGGSGPGGPGLGGFGTGGFGPGGMGQGGFGHGGPGLGGFGSGGAGQGGFGQGNPGSGRVGQGGPGLGGFDSGGFGLGGPGLGGFGPGGTGQGGFGYGGFGADGEGFGSGFGAGPGRSLPPGVLSPGQDVADGWDTVKGLGSAMRSVGIGAMAAGTALIGAGLAATLASGGAGAPIGGAVAVGGGKIMGIGAMFVVVGSVAEAVADEGITSKPTEAPISKEAVPSAPAPAPSPASAPSPKTNYPAPDDYYPNPEGTGGGGPASAGLITVDSIAAIGEGVNGLLVQLGARTFRVN